MVVPGATEKAVRTQAESLIQKWLSDKSINKVIFIPNRLINFVIK